MTSPRRPSRLRLFSRSPSHAWRVAAFLCLVAASTIALSGTAGCLGSKELGFKLKLPANLADRVVWFEVAAFRDAQCPPLQQLGAGLPLTGTAARLAFRKQSQITPALATLDRGNYAFMAVAKDENCTVVATGCTSADVGSVDEILISLKENPTPTGTCEPGTICQAAQCVPSSDIADPSVGAGCSMELLGAGPLGNPLSSVGGVLVSGPSIVPTSQGFLIGYREYDPLAGTARLTFLPIDNGGGAQTPRAETLPDRCSGADESDGVGLSLLDDTGLAIVSRTSCPDRSGFDLYSVAESGDVLGYGQQNVAGPTATSIALANAKALARLPGKAGFLLATVVDGRAAVSTTTRTAFAGAAVPFGGTPPHYGAWIDSSDRMVALLASGDPVSVIPPVDAGADGGSEGGPPPIIDSGAASRSLRLQLAAGDANLSTLGTPITFPGTWGSLAVQGTRAVVVSDGPSRSRPVSFRIFDLGATEPAIIDGFSTISRGNVSAAGVAFVGDRLFFVVEGRSLASERDPAFLGVVAFDGATTTPSFLREVSLGDNPRVPSIRSVRDGRIAIAATDTRVAVAWTTGRELDSNDAVGGYAVMACRTP